MPPFDLLNFIAGRVFILWLSTRIIVFGGMAIAQIPLKPSLSISLQVILVVLLLYAIDVIRRGERLLLANLGLDPRNLLIIVGLILLLAEGLLSLALTALPG